MKRTLPLPQEALDQLYKYEAKLKVWDLPAVKKEAEEIVDIILKDVSSSDERFELNEEKRGSAFEKLKIDEPDEFDFDLPILDLETDHAPDLIDEGKVTF